jgi:LacI family transcriptional regulator
MRVRIKDIADRAGVSTGTVDRVIHNRGEVSLKTRDKVLGILKEMEYQPDILASTLASRHPLKVAVLIPFHTTESWFWQEPLEGINDAISELAHFRIEMKEYLYDQFSREDFIMKANHVLKYRPDAVIAAPVFYREMMDFMDQCSTKGIPFISVNDNISHPDQMAYVGQDARQSGAVAGNLIRNALPAGGHVLVISIARDRDNNRHIQLREEGFTGYWENEEKQVEIIRHAISNEGYRHIETALSGLLKQFGSVCGIFVTNSRVYHIARYLENTDLKDIPLVGYDLIQPNIEYLDKGVINFLISQKPREQGYRAMITVFNRLRMNRNILPEQMIPIDIICKENLCCYQV